MTTLEQQIQTLLVQAQTCESPLVQLQIERMESLKRSLDLIKKVQSRYSI